LGRECRQRRNDGHRGRERGKLTASLQWQLNWGDKIEWLEDLAEEDGVEPKALQERPQLPDHLQFVWSAWWELHTDRPVGMAVGAIPFSAIDRYAARYGIDGMDHFDAFREAVRALDGAYLKWAGERRSSSIER